MDGGEINCDICKLMLKAYNFSPEGLQEVLAEPEKLGEQLKLATGLGEGPAEAQPAGRAQAEDEDADMDPWDYVRKTGGRHIELLPAGSYGKAFPFRCTLCKTRRMPEGKINDLCFPDLKSVKYFLGQHLDSNTHVKKLREYELKSNPEAQKNAPEPVECSGLQTTDPVMARSLYVYLAEFNLWASMANFASQANVKHSYTFDANSKSWTIKAGNCLKTTAPDPLNSDKTHHTCGKCWGLGDSHSIVRSAQKFAVKYYAAELLSLRLFSAPQAVEKMMEEIREKMVYKTDKLKFKTVLATNNVQLQQYVRCTWLSDCNPSEPVQRFIDTVVSPCLQCNIATIPDRLADTVASFQALIRSGQLSDSEMVNIKVASSVLRGDFESHPLLLGLCLQTKRKLQKMERGIETMAGRRSKESLLEKELISDAGVQLACATGNSKLAVEFGISNSGGKILLEQLASRSLPNPALALCHEETLRMNFTLVDQRYVRRPAAPKRSLFVLDCVGIFWIFLDYFGMFRSYCLLMLIIIYINLLYLIISYYSF